MKKILKSILKGKVGYLYWYYRSLPMRKDFPSFNILSIEKTIEKIIVDKICISRFGDGEFLLLLKKRDIVFQKLTNEISDHLVEVINSNLKNHLVCLANAFSSRKGFIRPSKIHWLNFINIYGKELSQTIKDHNKTYGNAMVSRFYYHKKNKKGTAEVVKMLKSIWEGQDILFVEGKFSRLGIANDFFNNAKSIQRIICPSTDAYEKFDEIKKKVIQHGNNKLIILALGPTATILAYELAKMNFWTLDLGHIDIEYSWYRSGAKSKIPVRGRKVAEAGNVFIDDLTKQEKEEYQNSIVEIVE